MPRAARRPINKKIYEELNGYFTSLISSLANPQEIDYFFKDFLTSEEKIMLTKRLMLHLMLENGYKIFQIEFVLGMSRETIRVHQNIWSRGGETYKRIIKKLAGRERAKKFWEKIEKILKPLDLILRAKTDIKARAKLASGQYD